MIRAKQVMLKNVIGGGKFIHLYYGVCALVPQDYICSYFNSAYSFFSDCLAPYIGVG